MTRKAAFNAEDWSIIVGGPVYAGMLVMSATRGGTLKETLAMGRVYQEARSRHGESELLDELVASPPAVDADRLRRTGDDLAQATVDHLHRAMAILEATATPREVDDYKRFVMTVAQVAAAAHKEGGFLGIGGRAVSEAEDAALDEISIALGPPPAD